MKNEYVMILNRYDNTNTTNKTFDLDVWKVLNFIKHNTNFEIRE